MIRNLLLTAANIMRTGGLVRGLRETPKGAGGPHCLLGAIDEARRGFYGKVPPPHTYHIAKIVAKLLPEAVATDYDTYNRNAPEQINRSNESRCAWWSNMVAPDAEAVAQKLELAANSIVD